MCLAVLAVIGFTPTIATADRVVTTTETIYINEVKTDFIKTAENFIILYDASSSMSLPYKKTGMRRIDIEKENSKNKECRVSCACLQCRAIHLYTFGGP